MKSFQVIRFSSMWSTKALTEKEEIALVDKTREGWEIVSVSFGFNIWWVPTAYITVAR